MWFLINPLFLSRVSLDCAQTPVMQESGVWAWDSYEWLQEGYNTNRSCGYHANIPIHGPTALLYKIFNCVHNYHNIAADSYV